MLLVACIVNSIFVVTLLLHHGVLLLFLALQAEESMRDRVKKACIDLGNVETLELEM